MGSGLEAVFAGWLGVVGLAVGSFLNVVIARVPQRQSIVRPGSRCPKCGHALAWYENIPLFSWLALRARCRACRQPISARYPLVELLTALLFLGALRQLGWTWELVSALLLVCFLVPLAFIDLDTWLLPHELTWPGITVGILVAVPLGLGHVRDAAIGAAAAFVAFWLMEGLGRLIFRKEALGGGDKDLLALIGAFLTYKALLGVVFLASLQGSIVGLLLLAIRGRAGPAPEGDGAGASGEGTGAAGASTGSARTGEGHEGTGSAGASTSSAPTGEGDEDGDDWVPGPTNMPFGPWLAVAALEVLLLGPWLSQRFGPSLALLFGGR